VGIVVRQASEAAAINMLFIFVSSLQWAARSAVGAFRRTVAN